MRDGVTFFTLNHQCHFLQYSLCAPKAEQHWVQRVKVVENTLCIVHIVSAGGITLSVVRTPADMIVTKGRLQCMI